jgi:hypothetical protein
MADNGAAKAPAAVVAAKVAVLVAADAALAALVAALPQGVLGYVEASADTTTGVEADVAGLSRTVTVAAGRRIKVTVQAQINNDGNAGIVIVRIREGATEKQRVCCSSFIAAGNVVAHGSWVATPSTGSHTYKVTIEKASGAGTVTLVGSVPTIIPAFILVEDIGV